MSHLSPHEHFHFTPKPHSQSPRRMPPAASKVSARKEMAPFQRKRRNTVVPSIPKKLQLVNSPQLTEYEQDEVLSYPDAIFFGTPESKKLIPSDPKQYDDCNHCYRGKIGDHIIYRYEIESILGRGAFGVVYECLDHETKQKCAIKVVTNDPKYSQQVLSELQYMIRLNSDTTHPYNHHIVKLLSHFTFRNHLCICIELLGPNLYRSVLRQHDSLRGLRFKRIAREILEAINHIHSCGIVHCDLKPENILIIPNSPNDIKLIDFGTSCNIGAKHFDYIQTRSYRAPEVMFGYPYSTPIDIWSYGCLLAEFARGLPLFPGNSEEEVFEKQISLLGPPPIQMGKNAPRRKHFFTPDGNPKKKGIKSSKSRIDDSLLLDLIIKCLNWDPEQRLTADVALEHPWLKIEDTPSLEESKEKDFEFDFELKFDPKKMTHIQSQSFFKL